MGRNDLNQTNKTNENKAKNKKHVCFYVDCRISVCLIFFFLPGLATANCNYSRFGQILTWFSDGPGSLVSRRECHRECVTRATLDRLRIRPDKYRLFQEQPAKFVYITFHQNQLALSIYIYSASKEIVKSKMADSRRQQYIHRYISCCHSCSHLCSRDTYLYEDEWEELKHSM